MVDWWTPERTAREAAKTINPRVSRHGEIGTSVPRPLKAETPIGQRNEPQTNVHHPVGLPLDSPPPQPTPSACHPSPNVDWHSWVSEGLVRSSGIPLPHLEHILSSPVPGGSMSMSNRGGNDGGEENAGKLGEPDLSVRCGISSHKDLGKKRPTRRAEADNSLRARKLLPSSSMPAGEDLGRPVTQSAHVDTFEADCRFRVFSRPMSAFEGAHRMDIDHVNRSSQPAAPLSPISTVDSATAPIELFAR
ncbi:hypothetical protein BDK51DRAFT_38318 [Blyttiomyces helicus]|uniref:Uncharacterized protein n=1 Tax=Blyttiomyces helicus TaxID=388810 RepID=A0A4P9W5J7_9FUNG|nr:hypothetical protein BDK51DRAFT_38318 [Blyttiomyces helicus]|eukprot:RKO86188.1 hypothetical protein BDK51DRAFT_38318 [Blyttiomyces helicus]